MASRLELLNRVGIFYLNLFAAGTYLHFISETNACAFQVRNARRQILHLKNHAVPSAGLLLTAIGHGPRSRSAGTAQDQLEATDRNLAESGQVLHVQMEPKRLCIERDGPLNVFGAAPV